jgi:uracil-DNA glycosylase
LINKFSLYPCFRRDDGGISRNDKNFPKRSAANGSYVRGLIKYASPASHQGKGWEQFTDAAIRLLSEKREGLVFILWGRPAQLKEKLIDTSKHIVLKAAHPSPLSAYNGFFGCKHFSGTNKILIDKGKTPINWQII